ncbi:MAG: DMT family transporter [Caldilineaceae bacterium SB0664_bin_22]|nr:DMT family transporter [Caldilineaceae bacterium SB0664_bin_22]
MKSSINTTMGGREWTMLLTLSLLWGGSFFFIAIVVSDLPPLTTVILRVGLAALTLWGIVLVMGLRPPRSLEVWVAFFGMGLLNNVIPFSLIVWGHTYIASGLASILNAATPLFTIIIAGLLFPDEGITPNKIIGVVIGFGGIVVMFLSGLGEGKSTLAQIAVLGAALSYAFAGTFGRRFKRMDVNPIVTAAGQVTTSTVILAPMVFYIDGPLDFAKVGMDSWAAIIGLAVLSTAAAYVLYFKILETAGATNLLLVTLLIPVSAILLGSLVLGEMLELVHFAGMTLIAFGLWAIDGRLWRHRTAWHCESRFPALCCRAFKQGWPRRSNGYNQDR